MAKIKLRRDTAANWLNANPVLANGETGFETDTRMVKLGDGTTAWADLKYAVTGNLQVTDDTIHGDDIVSFSSGMGDRTNWVLTINTNDGNPSNPQPANAYATAVAYDSEGNTFMTGVYDDPYNGDKSGMFLIKTDPNGQVLFNNFYDEFYAFGWSMIVDGNDDVIFVMAEFDGSSADTVLVKVSGESGTFIWQKYLADTDSASDDVALCVDVDASNNVIIAGQTATGGNQDFWVGKFNGLTGAPIWQKQYNSDGCIDAASGIAVDNQGNIAVVGSSYGPGTFLGVFKLNGANGNVIWQKRIINVNVQANEEQWNNAWVNGDLFSSDICVDTNNDFYFSLTGLYCTPWIVAGVHKVSSAGEWKWSKVISYADFLSGSSSLICDSDNNLYLTSTVLNYRAINQNVNDFPQFGTVITKFNASGRKLWGKSLIREQADVYAGGGQGSNGELAGVGQTVAVNDDYILVAGGFYMRADYQPGGEGGQNWYNKSFIAQLDKAGTDFVKDGWIFKDNTYKIFNMTVATDDDNWINDLTVSTADIIVTNGEMFFEQNTDTYSLAYINTARAKPMTLSGDRLHLPENGGMALSRKHIGHYTSIGKGFEADGSEGANTGGSTWINGVTGDAAGNVYAVGGWYNNAGYTWNDTEDSFDEEIPLIWKIDSEGAIVWTAGNNLNQWGADMIDVAYNAAAGTVVAMGYDNDDSLDFWDGAEGFNVFTLDAGSGALKSVVHVRDTGVNKNNTEGGSGSSDMYPRAIALKSNGTPVVVGGIESASDKFANVTSGAAGLTGSGSGVLVINKSVFDRAGNQTDVDYPSGSGYWYIDNSAIQYVNRYAGVASVTLTGGGANATFTVTANPATNAYTAVKVNGGTGYAVDDTLKVIGSLLGGVNTTNDALITVTGVDAGAITTVTVTGTGQTTKIKLDISTSTDFTQADTYNVWHVTGTDGFIWTPDWTVAVGGENDTDNINSLAIDSEDNIIVGGQSYSLNLEANTTDWGSYAQRAYVAKYNSAGVRQWAKSVDGHEGDGTVWGVAIDSDDNIYAVSTTGFYNSGYDPHVIKLDAQGNFVWMVQLDYYNNYFNTMSIATDSDDNIIISGSFESNDTATDRVGDNNNIQLAKFDKDSNPLWNRLLWSNNGMYTGYNDWYGNNLAVVGDKFVWGGQANAWNDYDDDTAVVAQLPVDGTGLGNNGNYYYDEVEVEIQRWTDNELDTGIYAVTDVSDRLLTRQHVLIAEAYPTDWQESINDPTGDDILNGYSGPMTLYANLEGKVADVLEEGGADITGVKEIVFEDGTRQSTTSQDIPQVDISLTNRGDDSYFLRLEDRGHHVFMEGAQSVDVCIPDYESVPFPVGTSIVIVTAGSSITIYSDNNNDLMWAVGLNQSSHDWTIPVNSMVTLLKIRQNHNDDGTPYNGGEWMIAGPGLTT